MLENTKGAIKNGQSVNIRYTWWRKTNTICDGHHYPQTNTNNANKTWFFAQTTGGKDEPNIAFMWKS